MVEKRLTDFLRRILLMTTVVLFSGCGHARCYQGGLRYDAVTSNSAFPVIQSVTALSGLAMPLFLVLIAAALSVHGFAKNNAKTMRYGFFISMASAFLIVSRYSLKLWQSCDFWAARDVVIMVSNMFYTMSAGMIFFGLPAVVVGVSLGTLAFPHLVSSYKEEGSNSKLSDQRLSTVILWYTLCGSLLLFEWGVYLPALGCFLLGLLSAATRFQVVPDVLKGASNQSRWSVVLLAVVSAFLSWLIVTTAMRELIAAII